MSESPKGLRNRDNARLADQDSVDTSSSCRSSSSEETEKLSTSQLIKKDRKMLTKFPNTKRKCVYFLCIGLSVFLLWTFMSYDGDASCCGHNASWWDENLYYPFGLQEKVYAVVVDAGSTGTRILGFEFYKSLSGIRFKTFG